MNRRRLRVGVIYGGRSGEHEVSLRSAASVIAALDPERYEVVPIAITKAGRWLSGPDSLAQLEEAQRTMSAAPEKGREVTIAPDPTRRTLLPLGAGPAGRARGPLGSRLCLESRRYHHLPDRAKSARRSGRGRGRSRQ